MKMNEEIEEFKIGEKIAVSDHTLQVVGCVLQKTIKELNGTLSKYIYFETLAHGICNDTTNKRYKLFEVSFLPKNELRSIQQSKNKRIIFYIYRWLITDVKINIAKIIPQDILDNAQFGKCICSMLNIPIPELSGIPINLNGFKTIVNPTIVNPITN